MHAWPNIQSHNSIKAYMVVAIWMHNTILWLEHMWEKVQVKYLLTFLLLQEQQQRHLHISQHGRGQFEINHTQGGAGCGKATRPTFRYTAQQIIYDWGSLEGCEGWQNPGQMGPFPQQSLRVLERGKKAVCLKYILRRTADMPLK